MNNSNCNYKRIIYNLLVAKKFKLFNEEIHTFEKLKKD